VPVYIFPLINIGKPSEDHYLEIRSPMTTDFVEITKPEEFSILGHLLLKDYGYVFHKCVINSSETNERTNTSLAATVSLFFERLKTKISKFREQLEAQAKAPASGVSKEESLGVEISLQGQPTPVAVESKRQQQPAVVNSNVQRNLRNNTRAHAAMEQSQSFDARSSSSSSHDEDDEDLFWKTG